MKSIKHSLLIAALVGTSISAMAQTPGVHLKGEVGYVIDQRGVVARSGTYGRPGHDTLCWRTGYWRPALAIAEMRSRSGEEGRACRCLRRPGRCCCRNAEALRREDHPGR